MYKWLTVVIITVLLVACGNKGKLYLPESDNAPQPAESSSN